MIVYHGTPITPRGALAALGPRSFCVSFFRPDCVDQVEAVAPRIMYDNGAYSAYTAATRAGRAPDLSWDRFYEWLEPRLFEPGRWAVVPDEIDAGPDAQDRLLEAWPFGERGAPVWHTDEPLDRLERLVDEWPRVCVGSSGAHWQVGGEAWSARLDLVWDRLGRRSVTPGVHMMRGLAVAHLYPFKSVDSTGLARNAHRYRAPLFRGSADEFAGVAALADRLERRAGATL